MSPTFFEFNAHHFYNDNGIVYEEMCIRDRTRTLNDYGRKAGLIKENESNLSGEDVREGLTAVVLSLIHI